MVRVLVWFFKRECIFMHVNAPFCVSKVILDFFEQKIFTGGKIMNPIENLWSVIKIELYEGGKNTAAKKIYGKQSKLPSPKMSLLLQQH